VFKNTSNTLSAVASITPTDLTRMPLPLYIDIKGMSKQFQRQKKYIGQQK